ncbi:MAG: hypothetical protein AAGF24_10525 [Cyanobacteria bacterium P01_H01_bin.121]
MQPQLYVSKSVSLVRPFVGLTLSTLLVLSNPFSADAISLSGLTQDVPLPATTDVLGNSPLPGLLPGIFNSSGLSQMVLEQLGNVLDGNFSSSELLSSLGQLIGETGAFESGALLPEILKQSGADSEVSPLLQFMTMPGVNPALAAPILALQMQTQALDPLSEAAQQAAAQAAEAVATTVQSTGQITESAEAFAQQAAELADTIGGQVNAANSTQQTLKAGLAGLATLQATQTAIAIPALQQNAQMAQILSAQHAVGLQHQKLLGVTNQQLMTLNEQINKTQQQQLAADRALSENLSALNQMHVYR